MSRDRLRDALRRPGLVGDVWRWTAGSAVGAARWVKWRHTIDHEMRGPVDRLDVPVTARGNGVKTIDDGNGPLYHRRYETVVHDATCSAEQAIQWLRRDPNAASPTEFALFEPMEGDDTTLTLGTDHVVHLPGPWNGPVRVVEVGARHFRLATLPKHLEAGEIEFAAVSESGDLRVTIESWARAGDPVMRLLHHDLRIGQEVQMHMWAHVLRRTAAYAGGTSVPRVRVVTEHSDDVDLAAPA